MHMRNYSMTRQLSAAAKMLGASVLVVCALGAPARAEELTPFFCECPDGRLFGADKDGNCQPEEFCGDIVAVVAVQADEADADELSAEDSCLLESEEVAAAVDEAFKVLAECSTTECEEAQSLLEALRKKFPRHKR